MKDIAPDTIEEARKKAKKSANYWGVRQYVIREKDTEKLLFTDQFGLTTFFKGCTILESVDPDFLQKNRL